MMRAFTQIKLAVIPLKLVLFSPISAKTETHHSSNQASLSPKAQCIEGFLKVGLDSEHYSSLLSQSHSALEKLFGRKINIDISTDKPGLVTAKVFPNGPGKGDPLLLGDARFLKDDQARKLTLGLTFKPSFANPGLERAVVEKVLSQSRTVDQIELLDLSLANGTEIKRALLEGKSPEEAFKATSFYQTSAQAGFSEIKIASPETGLFVVQRPGTRVPEALNPIALTKVGFSRREISTLRSASPSMAKSTSAMKTVKEICGGRSTCQALEESRKYARYPDYGDDVVGHHRTTSSSWHEWASHPAKHALSE
jgi:hypothetical protein